MADGIFDGSNSMGVFLTNVPCKDFHNYPDIQELFGTGLNKTIELFNERLYLPTKIIWLSVSGV
jgi:hypothetical protein